VHIEWRIHGILVPLVVIPRAVYVAMQRRIKFESKLKLNIETAAQDGHYTFAFQDRTINIRVATIPTRFGEAFTLRFLDPARGIVPLTDLGFPEDIKKKLSELVELPNGLILVTGPTGSGKTTTLYALLSTVTGKDRNIVTLEDPVEYELPGIIQSQIDPDHGYTFATGLRSILRHDPDIILVGEIRDYETAQTAIDASLTGHLVLATLHTNSSIEAIPRLLSMGVSPYTFAPALRAILAQRLVRTWSPACKGKQCDPSDPASFAGQRALPELLVASPAIRELILSQAHENEIEEAARKEGYLSMREWGDIFVKEGSTPQEEVARVTA
jgi:general secretion pathway protein E